MADSSLQDCPAQRSQSNLARELVLILESLASPSQTYTSERLPVIAEMLGFTTSLHEKASSGYIARLVM